MSRAPRPARLVFGPYRWLAMALPAVAVLVGVGLAQVFDGRTGSGVAMISVALMASAAIVWATAISVRNGRTSDGGLHGDRS